MILRAMICCLTLAPVCAAAEFQPIRLSADGKHFVGKDSGEPFVPWGFNYDHDSDGRLIEAYWHGQWDQVESDFREMKQLGANVVRIHLQFGEFMQSPNQPRQGSLDQLARLVQLAEQTRLYLNVTGLGCYHKAEVPPWYDRLSEAQRWAAQAAFWEAVAKTCSGSPAIFCYDLMNEPVVPGGDQQREDWLGPGFGDKHFTQFISLQRGGRDRPEIARQWIRTLVTAIRRHDSDTLVTVGLVPWSLDRPGLTSGFVPEKIAEDLDFIAVHLYPEQGKLDETLRTLEGFAAAGKPVVIEEIFPLRCDANELGRFIDQSQAHAVGWIGFYWGTTLQQYRHGEPSIQSTLMLSWLELFQEKGEALRDSSAGTAIRDVR
jgi:hypothetical protein